MIADTIACLRLGWHIKAIGEANGSIILADYGWFFLCDNGGEFNVGKINDDASMRSIPYTDLSYFDLLDGGTMAYRVFCAIRGEEIDYRFRCPEIIEARREAA